MKQLETITRGETIDAVFDGRVKLYQSRSGYRFSLDAVLLAHFVKIKDQARIVDLGAGNGAVTLMLAALHPSAHITGMEIQPRMVRRARRSVLLNGFERRISFVRGDVRALAESVRPESFDVAVCNPPYRSPLSGRVSPNMEKRIARHEFKGTLEQFLRAGNYLLPKKGGMALVYPALRSIDLLASLRAAGIEPKRLRMVHSSYGSEASLVLAEGIKGGKSEIVVEAPLFIYDEQRRYCAEVAAMLRGGTVGS